MAAEVQWVEDRRYGTIMKLVNGHPVLAYRREFEPAEDIKDMDDAA